MQTRTRSWLTTLGALIGLLTACGGGVDPTLSVAVVPSQLTVTTGNEVQTALTLTRNETATDDVALTVSGLPEGVSATFAPATVPGAESAATLTFSAAHDAADAHALVTITATHPGEEPVVATTSLSILVRGVTIEGQAVSPSGEPRPGVRVHIGNTSTTSDAEGRFTFENVRTPYDLIVESRIAVEVLQGLTTPQPLVRAGLFDDATGLPNEGELEFSLSAPVPAEHRLIACLEGSGLVSNSCSNIGVGETGGSVRARWDGAATTRPAKLHLVEYVIDASGAATAYTGAAALEVVLDAEQVTVVDAVTLGPPPAHEAVTPTVTTPDWAEGTMVSGFLKLGNRLAAGPPPVPGAAVLKVEGAPVVAMATGGAVPNIGLSWTQDLGMELTFPSKVELLTPAGEYQTAPQLTVSPPAEGELTAAVTMYPSGGGKMAVLYTMSDVLVTPDLSRYGIPSGSERGTQLLLARGSGYAGLDDVVGERGSPVQAFALMMGVHASIPASGSVTINLSAGAEP